MVVDMVEKRDPKFFCIICKTIFYEDLDPCEMCPNCSEINTLEPIERPSLEELLNDVGCTMKDLNKFLD